MRSPETQKIATELGFDILWQEFIARGSNDADVATVYESIALHRWEQSGANQGNPYQIYYLDPTIETTSTAVIVR